MSRMAESSKPSSSASKSVKSMRTVVTAPSTSTSTVYFNRKVLKLSVTKENARTVSAPPAASTLSSHS